MAIGKSGKYYSDLSGPGAPPEDQIPDNGKTLLGEIANKAGPVANALAPGGRRLATKAAGALVDVALDATPVGANSDRVPPPSERQRQAMDIEVRQTPTGAVQKKRFR